MRVETSVEPGAGMAARQGATPPAWLSRSRWRLLWDVVGSPRANGRKLVHLFGLLAAFFRPGLVRRRLERLRALGHVEVVPSLAQLWMAARDQMMLGATEETRIFYRDQGIPWVFHNVRRLVSGPATMLDPLGLFSPRAVLIAHVLQTFHRHPVYDLVLLRAHEGGVEELARQAERLRAGHHPDQRALTSLIEDGSYHARLPDDIAQFMTAPLAAARPVPIGLLDDPHLMLAMDQFKDLAGMVRYAARLRVGPVRAILAWAELLVGRRLPEPRARHITVAACDPDLVARHVRV